MPRDERAKTGRSTVLALLLVLELWLPGCSTKRRSAGGGSVTPPATCPPLSCFGSALHSVICDGHVSQNPDGSPRPARGCRHVLDSTAYFGGCGPNFRCDGECDPSTSRNGCCNGLKQTCEDPRGPVWVQKAGPAAGGCRDEVGKPLARSYLCRLDALKQGTYRFDVCDGGDWTGRDGKRNPGHGCSRTPVTFRVP